MSETSQLSFALVDYGVCLLVLAISTAIGFYYRFTGGRQSTQLEYLLAGRSMGVVPVACSLLASFMSAVTLMGVTAENYLYGTQFVLINLSYGLATPIVAYLFLPTFYLRSDFTVYQYLESRFGGAVRTLCSLVFMLMMVLYTGVVLYAPAQALSAVSGLSVVVSLLVVGGVCTLYSTVGGMKAVLITDMFQTLLMFCAVFLVVIVGCARLGGVSNVWDIASQGGRLEFFNFSWDPRERHTVWTQLVGGMFIYLSLYAVNQAQVQRLLSVSSLRRAQGSLWLQWPILSLLSVLTSFAGLVMYAFYRHCDPLTAQHISAGDQLLPYFVLDTMSDKPGLPGLFLAGIFSGSLSTVSSAVTSMAAVCIQDFIKPCCGNRSGLSEGRELCITKLLCMLLGGVCVLFGYVASQSSINILPLCLAVFGAVGGPLLAVFSLGMFTTRANNIGASVGLLLGLSLTFTLSLAPQFDTSLAHRTPKLPLSTSLCSVPSSNLTLAATSLLLDNSMSSGNVSLIDTLDSLLDQGSGDHEAEHNSDAETVLGPEDEPGRPALLRNLFAVSYMWLSVIGFTCSFLVGYLVSVCCCCCCARSPAGQVEFSSSLLSPPVAALYRSLGWLRDEQLAEETKMNEKPTFDATASEQFTRF